VAFLLCQRCGNVWSGWGHFVLLEHF
jgi:hypothetical protein